ncbi:MAG: PKD domain-containing protein [Bacteroidetes bacterium]|nr:PKD domain-containing protein [Bacteroidota bacterium]
MPKIFIAIMVLLYTNNTFAQCEVEITPNSPVYLCPGESVELTTNVSNADLSIDQQQLLYLGGESARNLPGYSTWQSFTAGVTGDLVQIDQGFFNEMTGTATLNIFTGTGNGGTGAGNFWETFIIDPPVPITENEVYTFEIVPDLAGGLPDPYGVQVSGPADNYAGGRCEFDVTWDDVFKTYVSAPITYTWSTGATTSNITVNEPGTYTVNISDGAGCSATDEVTVIVTK